MHQEIYRIASQLNAQGKTPSVALIRSKLTVPTSLPVIVQALQRWKQSPDLGNEPVTEQNTEATAKQAQTTEVDAQTIAAMQAQIQSLEQKVAQLYQIIESK